MWRPGLHAQELGLGFCIKCGGQTTAGARRVAGPNGRLAADVGASDVGQFTGPVSRNPVGELPNVATLARLPLLVQDDTARRLERPVGRYSSETEWAARIEAGMASAAGEAGVVE